MTQYPSQTQYTAIALGYKNKKYVADLVMPKVQVAEEKYEYANYDLKDNFTPVDTKMGATGEVNMIERKIDLAYGGCVDHGLGEMIPNKEIDNAKKRKLDAIADSTETLSEKMALNREIRVAKLTQDKSNYNHSIELETDVVTWLKDPNSEVEEVIEAAIKQPVATPDRMVVGSHIWQLIRKNPSLLKAIYRNNKDGLGAVQPQDFKEYFGLSDIIIATARHNTNNQAQQLHLSAVWGDVLAFHYNPKTVRNLRHDLAWGMTAEYQKPKTQQFKKPESGSMGSVKNQITHIYNEQILSKDAGCIILPKQGG